MLQSSVASANQPRQNTAIDIERPARPVPSAGVLAAGKGDRCKGTAPIPHEMVREGRVVVLDGSGDWLTSWHQNYAAFGIDHLRSDMSMHPGPHDVRELLAFAHVTKRTREGQDLLRMTKMERNKEFQGPYEMPSSSLFKDYCQVLIKAYELEGVVRKGVATRIVRHAQDLYSVHLDDGNVIQSRRLVCALGPSLRREKLFWEAENQAPEHALVQAHQLRGWLEHLHTSKDKKRSAQPQRVVIVGGGITSAHLAKEMVKAGSSEVTLLARSELRVRQFDIPRAWSGPSRGRLMEEFQSLDGQERADLLRESRPGGSIPPEVMADLDKLVKSGKVQLHTGVEVSSTDWKSSQGEGHWRIELNCDCSAIECDVILLAIGADLDIKECILRDMMEQAPTPTCQGLPMLQYDLSWSKADNLYVMGAMAGLQLGPDALNLAGARHGACRIAQKLRRELRTCDCLLTQAG